MADTLRNATLRLMAAATKIERDVLLLDLTNEEYESLARAAIEGAAIQASIVTYIESFAHKRGRWARVMFLALAGNIAAGLHEEGGEI